MSNSEIDDAYAALEAEIPSYFAQGGRLAVVKAPPGSGKTHLLITVLQSLIAAGKRVAVATQTNAQADDVCRRVFQRDESISVTRFVSQTHPFPDGWPVDIGWVSKSGDLPHGAGVVVSTTAKWSLTNIAAPFDVLAVDEAWQMAWADLMQCATVSERFLLIGDPGQIPPVVTIDVRRWETSPRAPHLAAPNVVLADKSLQATTLVRSLPACRRLPHESVAFVKPFYDFDFDAYTEPQTRGVDVPTGHPLQKLADGRPLAVTVPTPAEGPPLEVDHGVAQAAATLVESLLETDARVRVFGDPRRVDAVDIGISSSHRAMNSAIETALKGRWQGVRVDTPERWQGLERPIMIAIHPLSGVTAPSPFDLETGRLCVMASRHQAALIVLTRDHIGRTLADLVPAAEQAPGRPDLVGRGHDAHVRFWDALATQDRLVEFT